MKNENEEIRVLFDTLTPNVAQKEKMQRAILTSEERKSVKRLSVKPILAAVVAAIICTAGVCAGVPAVREYINMMFLREDSVTRLTEVPEGWIGVYTVEDLESVREDLDGCYILMNDIVIPDEYYEDGGIYENGFVPIGKDSSHKVIHKTENEQISSWESDAFKGIFNGNGYEISNVHITDPEGTVAGLFGACRMQYDIRDTKTGEIFQKVGGIIKNLGVTDSSIILTAENSDPSDVSIGMIVGKGAFVVGCYTSNVQIQYSSSNANDAPDTKSTVCIGGVAGKANVIDSCWSDAYIRVDATNPECENPYVAGVCGWSKSCVTSYFCGTIDSPMDDWGVCYLDPTDPPEILNETVMREILYQILCYDTGLELDRDAMEELPVSEIAAYMEETHGIKLVFPENKDFNYHRIWAYYCGKLNINPQDFLTYKVEENEPEYVYLLDPCIDDSERAKMSEILSLIFEDEEFIRFCQENGIKFGAYNNYDLRSDSDCTFEGFDFDYIWEWGEDGLPKLRLSSHTGQE